MTFRKIPIFLLKNEIYGGLLLTIFLLTLSLFRPLLSISRFMKFSEIFYNIKKVQEISIAKNVFLI